MYLNRGYLEDDSVKGPQFESVTGLLVYVARYCEGDVRVGGISREDTRPCIDNVIKSWNLFIANEGHRLTNVPFR